MAEEVARKGEQEMTIGTCGNCRFSLPAKNPDGTLDFNQRWCRAVPPTPMWMPTQKGPVLQSMWPTLDANAVCGLHQFPGNADALPGERRPEEERAQ